MPSSINKAIIIGNLGKDPEIRQTQEGMKIVNFSVATTESWKDKATGEKRDRTEWHRVVIFSNGLGEIAERYLHKGSKVYVEGALRTRKWQGSDGQDRYSTEVVISNFDGTFIMLDGKRSSGGEQYQATSTATTEAPKPKDDIDDEIPF